MNTGSTARGCTTSGSTEGLGMASGAAASGGARNAPPPPKTQIILPDTVWLVIG
jgi:hypothetical protein